MKKVVIIDDEIDFCTLVQRYCTREGVECRYATTLQSGMELLNTFTPQVLIMDNNLPDGFGWLQAHVLMEKYPQLKIHFITAKNFNEKLPDQSITASSNKVFYHIKPLSLDNLRKILAL